MKLIRKQKVTYYDCICTGALELLEDDKPLAKLLKKFDDGGVDEVCQDAVLSKFAEGLLSNFEKEGLINGKLLTPKAREIIQTQKSWKALRGRYKLEIVMDGAYCCIVNCEPYYSDDTKNLKLYKDKRFQFIGEFENSKGMHLREVKLDPAVYLSDGETIDLDCVYDYETSKNSYAIETENGRIEFPENPHTFKIIDNSKSEEFLSEALSVYGCFSRRGTRVMLDSYDKRNPLIDEVLTQIFKNGDFSTSIDENSRIENVQTSIIDSSVAKSVLMEYLSRRASNAYCGISEIQTAISDFYSLFKDCVGIKEKARNVFEELMEYTSNNNQTAYLRLRAYEDLMPDDVRGNLYISQIKDYSGDSKSMLDLVKAMVGEMKIESVKTITKYAYRNPGISKAFAVFGDALKKAYGAELEVITAEDTKQYQNQYAKRYFDELLDNKNLKITMKSMDDIKDIHDRYFLFETSNGRVWYKMSGEIDALKYKEDFSDIDESTVGNIKEMTVYMVTEDGIPEKVKKIMEV